MLTYAAASLPRSPRAGIALALASGALVFGCGSSSGSKAGSTPACSGAGCAPGLNAPPPGSSSSAGDSSDLPGAPSGSASSDEAPSSTLPLAPGSDTAGSTPDAPSAPGAPAGTPVKPDTKTLLADVVKFYGAQRSGDGANWVLGGQSCHMNDGESVMADLSGGWYDAGDLVKPTLSIAYASYVLLKAFDAFPDSFEDRDGQRYEGAANGVPDVLDEARYATDYLVKAHLTETTLVGMVGNANQDHSMWVNCLEQEALPVAQGGRPRPVSMQANADIAGITAASLALMSRLYRPYDAALADSYQTHAVQIYQIGKNNPMGSSPGLYAQTGSAWLDEMMAGAAELYRLTNESSYLADALDFNSQIKNHGWAPNYSQSADFSRHTLYRAGASDAVADFWRLDVENYEAKVSTNQYTAGEVYIDEWASLRYAAGAAFSAALYSQVTGDTAARELAVEQLNYVTGDNSYARSFVIGFGVDAPSHPHHRNSDTLKVLLTGALVGGPTQRDYSQGRGANAMLIHSAGYQDVTTDYVGNEVALDYNAGLVGLAAFGVKEQVAAAAAGIE